MQISGVVHSKPETEMQKVLDGQKSVTTRRLKTLLDPLMDKVSWQEEALARNVDTIRRLNDRAQRAEENLKRERRKLTDYELEQRIYNNQRE